MTREKLEQMNFRYPEIVEMCSTNRISANILCEIFEEQAALGNRGKLPIGCQRTRFYEYITMRSGFGGVHRHPEKEKIIQNLIANDEKLSSLVAEKKQRINDNRGNGYAKRPASVAKRTGENRRATNA